MQICSHLLKKSLTENFIFCLVKGETVPNFLGFSSQYMISGIQENLWKICYSLWYFSEHFWMTVHFCLFVLPLIKISKKGILIHRIEPVILSIFIRLKLKIQDDINHSECRFILSGEITRFVLVFLTQRNIR